MKKKLTLALLTTFICAATAIKTTTFAMENTNQTSKTILTLDEQVKLEDDLKTEINNVKSNITNDINGIIFTLDKIKNGKKTAPKHTEIDKNIEKMESYCKQALKDIYSTLYDLLYKFKEHINIFYVYDSLENIRDLVRNLKDLINNYKLFSYDEFDSYVQKLENLKEKVTVLDNDLKKLKNELKKLKKEGNPSTDIEDKIKSKEEEIAVIRKEQISPLINASNYMNEDELADFEKKISSLTKQILEKTEKVEFVKEKPETNKSNSLDNISEENLMALFYNNSYTADEKFKKIEKTNNKKLMGKFLSLYVTKQVEFFMEHFDPETDNEGGLNFLKNCESFMENLSWLRKKLEILSGNMLDESTYKKYVNDIDGALNITKIYLNKTKNLEKELLNEYKNKNDDDIKKEAERIFNILSKEKIRDMIKNFNSNINTRDGQISLIVRYNIKVDNFINMRIDNLQAYLEILKECAKN